MRRQDKRIHVISYVGIPDVAFYHEKDVKAYLRKYGKSIKRVREDMQDNPVPDWALHTIEVK